MYNKATKTETLTYSQRSNASLKFAIEQLDFSEVKSVKITTQGEGMDTIMTAIIRYKKTPRDYR
jgi:hypothetical protein